MKYYRRLKCYKSNNLKLEIEPEVKAISYDWWVFVKVVNGLVVFNNYPYSKTTQRHQQKVKFWLNALGIKVDVYVSTHKSLDNSNWAYSASLLLKRDIETLQGEIEKKGTRKSKNIERLNKIQENSYKLAKLEENFMYAQ